LGDRRLDVGRDGRRTIDRTIEVALDQGVTLLDTAPVYGFGHSEEVVGKALSAGGRRERAVIATKVGLDWRDGKPFRNASRARILKEVDDSLRRLRTDVIDIYQVHWPDPKVRIEETAAAMGELYRAGKIRAIGVSNFSPAQMQAFAAVVRCTRRNRPTTCSNARLSAMSCPIAGTNRS
jgi:aryl-alcohol dehydrogenase-like predicted oxidoreductase